MKRKSAGSSKKSNDVRLLAVVLFIGIAIVFTVVAAFQTSRLVSNAYDTRMPLACGMKCNPQANTCPTTAPFCVQQRPAYMQNARHRCSQDPNVVTCALQPTGYPTPFTTRMMSPYPSRSMSPYPTRSMSVFPTRSMSGYPNKYPTLWPRPSCPDTEFGMPCMFDEAR